MWWLPLVLILCPGVSRWLWDVAGHTWEERLCVKCRRSLQRDAVLQHPAWRVDPRLPSDLMKQ